MAVSDRQTSGVAASIAKWQHAPRGIRVGHPFPSGWDCCAVAAVRRRGPAGRLIRKVDTLYQRVRIYGVLWAEPACSQ